MPSNAEARLILKGVDDNATSTIRKARGEMDGLKGSTDAVKKSTAESNLSFLAQAQALNQVSSGFQMVSTSLQGLNLLTEEQSRLLQQCGYFMKLFVGTAQMLQGVITLVNALKASETALAVVQAFRTALIPFVGVVLVGIAVALAGVVAAKLAGWFQTAPGQTRTVQTTGTATVHRGEIIGRPASGGGFGGATVHVNIQANKLDLGSEVDRYLFAKQIARASRAGGGA